MGFAGRDGSDDDEAGRLKHLREALHRALKLRGTAELGPAVRSVLAQAAAVPGGQKFVLAADNHPLIPTLKITPIQSFILQTPTLPSQIIMEVHLILTLKL